MSARVDTGVVAAQLHAKPGELVRLVRWFMTADGSDYQVRTGVLTGVTPTQIQIVENNRAVTLPRAEWQEYLP